MSKNPLTATPIVNKLGVATTVHRRASTNASAAKAVPAPQLAVKPASGAALSTPLTPPEPMSDSHYERFRDYIKGNLISLRKTNPSREEVELIQRMHTEDHVPDSALGAVTDYMGMFSPGERIKHYDYNMLLLTERFCKEEGPDIFNHDEVHIFTGAVRGLCHAHKVTDRTPIKKITTEEELDGHVAVLRFVMHHRKDENGRNRDPKTIDIMPFDNPSSEFIQPADLHVIDNHSLTALLRERPQDYDRIIQYVDERGIPKNKAQVATLNDYLDTASETPLHEGWL